MSAQVMPIGMDLSEAAKKRHKMIVDSMGRLQHFAYRAKFIHELTNEDVVVVCIKVDSDWRPIVDALMPGHNWQEIRDLGQEPVARGTACFSICEVVADILPDIADVLLEKPSDNCYKCIVLDEGGGIVYEIKPIQQTQLAS